MSQSHLTSSDLVVDDLVSFSSELIWKCFSRQLFLHAIRKHRLTATPAGAVACVNCPCCCSYCRAYQAAVTAGLLLVWEA